MANVYSSVPNPLQSPLGSALNSKINPPILGRPTSPFNVGSGVSLNSSVPAVTAPNPQGQSPLYTGIKSILGVGNSSGVGAGLINPSLLSSGNPTNSGFFQSTSSTPSKPAPTNNSGTTTTQGAAGPITTTAGGGYAGSPSTNPYYTPPTAATNTQTVQPPTPPSGSPAGSSSTSGNTPTLGGLVGTLAGTVGNPTAPVTAAQNAYNNIQSNFNLAQENLHAMPYSQDTVTGRNAILQNQYSQSLRAAAQNVTNALTAQDQGYGNLRAATSASAPVTQFGVQTNPTTGQPISGGTALSAAIQGGQIQGAQKAAASNASTAGTAVTNANAGGLQDSINSYQTLNTQYQGAQNLGNLLISTMQTNGINPTDSKTANQTIGQLKNEFSSDGYAKFLSTLNNVQSAYSNILASGGGTIPTAATTALQTIVDPNASLSAVQSAISQLNQEVYTGKLLPLYNQTQSYQSALSGSGTSGSQPSTASSGAPLTWANI